MLLEPVPRHPLRPAMHLMLMSSVEKVSSKGGVQLGAVNLPEVMTKHHAVRPGPWQHSMSDILRALLELFYESVKRIIARYSPVFLASIMFLLVGVVALSAATRQPRLRACSGPWHTYKAGHMTEPEPHEISVANAAEPAQLVVAEARASRPRYVPDEETLPIALPLTVQKHHFRSPPFLQ